MTPIRSQKSSRRGSPRVGLIVFLCLAAVLLGFLIYALISLGWNDSIVTAYYETRCEGIEKGFRIVLISDLHRKKFDETNQTLVNLAASREPDIICVDGDMLEKDHTAGEDEQLRYLLERLNAIAPVYFSAGNHDYTAYCVCAEKTESEYAGMRGRSDTLDLLESTGAVFLESAYADVEINGERVRIGGFYPFAFRSAYDTDESWEKRRAFLEDYCDTDRFKLMLSHRPDTFIYEDAGSAWEIDLVLSGHTHNGVVALPFGLGALWTSEGLFPEHDRGEFDLGSMRMIITSGFAGNRGIPRVFNPPEIAVIDVLPSSGG